MLHVVLDLPKSPRDVYTSEGKELPVLSLRSYLESEICELAEELKADTFPYEVEGSLAACGKSCRNYTSPYFLGL